MLGFEIAGCMVKMFSDLYVAGQYRAFCNVHFCLSFVFPIGKPSGYSTVNYLRNNARVHHTTMQYLKVFDMISCQLSLVLTHTQHNSNPAVVRKLPYDHHTLTLGAW